MSQRIEHLSLKGVRVFSAAGDIVAPLDLTLKPGIPLTIVGETGSGKSLLAQALIGNLPSELNVSGELWLGSTCYPLAERQQRALWGSTLATLPQEPWSALDPTMTCLPQVAETGVYARDLAWAEARESAKQRLADTGVSDAINRYPHTLSGGMAQRVAFAAASLAEAPVLLADEPTKGLDEPRKLQIIELLRAHVRKGGLLLTITHDLDVVKALSGDLAILYQGEIVEQGRADDILAAPRSEYGKALVAADPHTWPNLAPKPHAKAQMLAWARGLGKSRGGKTLFEDLSFSLSEGEVLGISGPSGCGKSSLGDILLGALRPDKGAIGLASHITPFGRQKLFQDPPSAFAGTVPLGAAIGHVAKRHGKTCKDIEALLEELHLSPELLARRPNAVSGGELQRLALLRLMLAEPQLLFADEPTSRLDLITQFDVIKLLLKQVQSGRMGLIIVSHHPQLIAAISHKTLDLGGAAALQTKGD